MRINDLVQRAGKTAKRKGFHLQQTNFATRIALMHSELSEALEEERNGHALDEIYFPYFWSDDDTSQKPEGVPIELADALIRIFDTAYVYGIDLERALELKMAYNEGRPYLHGKSY